MVQNFIQTCSLTHVFISQTFFWFAQCTIQIPQKTISCKVICLMENLDSRQMVVAYNNDVYIALIRL